MALKRFALVLVILTLLSMACSLTGNVAPTPVPATDVPPTAEAPEPTEVTVAEPTATTAPVVAEGQITTLEDVKKAIVQFEAQGSFVDPQFGQVNNVAGRGSGFIIDPSGLAVTNNHVVTGAALVKVWVGGENEPRNARILGVSECWDLALVDIDGDGFSYLPMYEGKVDTGMEVYAAGFPLGDPEYTLTKGIVSKAKAGGASSWADVPAVIEHDARIRPGNSGGPLVNAEGQVVGVNYAGNDKYDQNFAILATEAAKVVEKLKGGDFESMGINGQAVSNEDGSLTGIWVSSVKSGSPADKTGIEGGDILTKMEGLVLATDLSMSDYCSILRTRDMDDTMSVEVLRFSTQEVLNGQFNGDPLETSFSFAQEIADEAPGGTSGTSTTYNEYVKVQDDYGAIQVEIPSSWADVDGSAWLSDGDIIGSSIMAANSLQAFNNTYDEPGIFFGVSDDLAQYAGYVQVLDEYSKIFRQDCRFEGRNDYVDSAFEGKYELFSQCAGSSGKLLVLSARPIQNKTDYLITLYVNIMSDADIDALDRILASFDVVGQIP